MDYVELALSHDVLIITDKSFIPWSAEPTEYRLFSVSFCIG